MRENLLDQSGVFSEASKGSLSLLFCSKLKNICDLHLYYNLTNFPSVEFNWRHPDHIYTYFVCVSILCIFGFLLLYKRIASCVFSSLTILFSLCM